MHLSIAGTKVVAQLAYCSGLSPSFPPSDVEGYLLQLAHLSGGIDVPESRSGAGRRSGFAILQTCSRLLLVARPWLFS